MTPTPLPPVDLHEPARPVDHPTEHFTRLWPATPGMHTDAPFFLALMSPVRVIALGLLWATSSPGRFLIGLAAALALVAVLLIAV